MSNRTAQIGDKTYNLSPLSVGDLIKLEDMAEEAAHAALEKELELHQKNGSPKERLAELINAHFKKRDEGKLTGWYLPSLDGMALIVWMSIRRDHPDLELKDIKDRLSLEQAMELRDRIEDLSFPGMREKLAAKAAAKEQAAQQDQPASETEAAPVAA